MDEVAWSFVAMRRIKHSPICLQNLLKEKHKTIVNDPQLTRVQNTIMLVSSQHVIYLGLVQERAMKTKHVFISLERHGPLVGHGVRYNL